MRRPTTQRLARARTAPLPLLAAAAAVALALLGASCGGTPSADAEDALPAPETTSTTEAPTTSTTTLTDEAQVLDAVAGYWRTYFEANDPPDPNHPGFEKYFTGEAKAKSVANSQSRLESGRSIRPGSANAFSTKSWVMSMDVDRSEVAACVVDDSITVDTRTGQILNDAVYTFRFVVGLERVGGVWKVAELREVGRADGVDPTCAGLAGS